MAAVEPSAAAAGAPVERRLRSEWMHASMRIIKAAGTVIVSLVSSSITALRAISCKNGQRDISSSEIRTQTNSISQHTHIDRLLLVERRPILEHRRPNLDVVIDARRRQIRQRRMRLHTVDDMLIGLHQPDEFAGAPVPGEDVAAIGAGHDVVVAPE